MNSVFSVVRRRNRNVLLKAGLQIGIVLAFMMASNAFAQSISGSITGEETWSGTVFLSGDVTITETGKLTIAPGTRIECEPKFDDQVRGVNTSRIEIIVDGGILVAEGTQSAPILFTSAAQIPANDDWYGLRIKSDEVILRHCVIEYVDIGLLIEQNGLPVVEHCTFREAKWDGIRIEIPDNFVFNSCKLGNNKNYGLSSLKKASITLTNCIVEGNEKEGLNIDGQTVISGCSIMNNGSYGAYLRGTGLTHRIVNSLISENAKTGLYTGAGTVFNISGCTIERNGIGDPRSQADGIYGTAPLNITNCTIRENTGAGISLAALGDIGVTANTIVGNKDGIVFNSKDAILRLTGGNDIYNNTQYELNNRSAAAVIANDNYLGELTTQELTAGKPNVTKIFDSRDDRTVGEIFISTALVSPLQQSPSPDSVSYSRTIPSGVSTVAANLIATDVHWSGVVFLPGDVTITETGRLTIAPGTRIVSDSVYDNQVGGIHPSRVEIIVDGGVLFAEGTATEPIRFTSSADLPLKDDWYGLRIKSDQVTLRHCIVEYGNTGLLIQQNGLPIVENCTFRENSQDGIKVETPDTYVFSSCTLSNNAGYGFTSTNKAIITLTNCRAEYNGKDGLNIDGKITISQCNLSNNQGFGANLRGAGAVHVIRDTIVMDNVKTGLNTGTGASFSISGCTVARNGATGARFSASGIVGTTLLNIRDCTIRENNGAGIVLTQIGNDGITGNIISSNIYGINFNSRASLLTMSGGNDIYNNVEYELYNQSTTAIIANGNYLGELTTQEIMAGKINLTKIYDSRDNRGVGEILISSTLVSSMLQIPPPASINYRRTVPADISIVAAGVINGEATWSNTVFLLGDVTITETGKLTIAPGARIYCDPVYDNQAGGVNPSRIEIVVNGGILIAEGTQSAPILFTSGADVPAKDDWYGLRIISDKVTMRHCIVEYGDVGLLVEQNGLPVVENSTFRQMSSDGIRIEAPDNYTFTACTFSFNDDYGLNSIRKASITLTNCIVESNGKDGLNIDGKTIVAGGRIVQNTGFGANLRGADLIHDIFNAYIAENVKTGLNMGAGTKYTITGCTIERNGIGGARTQADGIYGTAPLNVRNCVIRENSGAGIALTQIGTEGVTGNVIRGNKFGITFNSREASLTFSTGNDIYDNTDYELNNQNIAAIIADGNYLGALTAQELREGKTNLTKIYDSRDNRNVGAINIRTWSDTPQIVIPPTPTPIPPTATPLPPSTPFPPTLTPTPTPITSAFIRGDVNLDGRVTPGDAQSAFDLYIKIISGEITATPPFTPGTDVWAADFNDDLRITPGDAQAIFDHYIASISGKTVSQRTVSAIGLLPASAAAVEVGTVEGNPGDTVAVPIRVTQGVNIRAFSLDLTYDGSRLEYVGLDRSGTTSESFSSVVGINLTNKVVISGFAGSADAVAGDAVFVKVLFKILPAATGSISLVPGEFLDDFAGALGISGSVNVIGTLNFVLSVGQVSAQVGEMIIVPIRIQHANSIRSFSFDIDTDWDALRYVRVEKDNTLTQTFSSLVGIANTNGGITIAGFAGGGDPAQGDGILVGLVFEVMDGGDGLIPISLTNPLDDLANAQIHAGEISIQVDVQNWLIY